MCIRDRYYPLAMHPERRLHIGNYAYKRMVRILPTYFFSVIVSAIYQVGRLDPALLREQFIGNMTLTQMSTPALAYNHLNPVLWSIAIEVQSYLIFPLILPLFRKKPYWVMAAAFVIGEGWRMYLRDIDYSRIGWLMNQLPGMIDVFVGGMLAAHIVDRIKRTLDDGSRAALRPAFTLAALMFAAMYFLAVMYIDALRYEDIPENLSRLQMHTRKFVSAAFCGAIAASNDGTTLSGTGTVNGISRVALTEPLTSVVSVQTACPLSASGIWLHQFMGIV